MRLKAIFFILSRFKYVFMWNPIVTFLISTCKNEPLRNNIKLVIQKFNKYFRIILLEIIHREKYTVTIIVVRVADSFLVNFNFSLFGFHISGKSNWKNILYWRLIKLLYQLCWFDNYSAFKKYFIHFLKKIVLKLFLKWLSMNKNPKWNLKKYKEKKLQMK